MDTKFNQFQTPKGAQAYMTLGMAQLIGNSMPTEGSDTVLDLINKAIEIDPTMYLGYERKADYYMKVEQPEEALKLLEKALELNPTCCHVVEKKIKVLQILDRKEEAGKFTDDFEEKYPGKLEEFLTSEKLRETVMKDLPPEKYGSMYQKAQAQAAAEAENYELAVKMIDMAIKFEPDSADLYSEKINYLNRLKKREEVISCYEKLLELDPKDINSCSLLAVTLMDSNPEKAVKVLNDFVEANPDLQMGFFIKGSLFVKMGKIEEGLKALDKGIEMDPKSPEVASAYVTKAGVARNEKKYEEALLYAKKSLEINPENPIVHCSIGDMLMELDKIMQALGSYLNTLELDPDNLKANKMISWILCEIDRPEEAIVFLEKICELEPSVKAYKDLAITLRGVGAIKKSPIHLLKASLYLKNVIASDPDDEDAKLQLLVTLKFLDEFKKDEQKDDKAEENEEGEEDDQES